MKIPRPPLNNNLNPILLGIIAGLSLALAFAFGFFVRDMLIIPGGIVRASTGMESYPLLDEVQVLLDQIYLREQPDATLRQYAAIRGVLGTLNDPNTFFIEPPVAQSEADALAGTYGGIGVLVQRNEAGEFLLFPFEDSPAAAAGITDGAILIAINDEVITLDDQQDLIEQKLRGEVKADSGVSITVRQDDEELSLFIEFAVINVPSVLWRVLEEDHRVGYLRISRFTNRTPDELRDALQALKAVEVQALILDVRDNSGGLLQEAVDVADEFLDGGVVIFEKSKGSEQVFQAQQGGSATGLAIVVLVNNRTASAAELVAGAIRDRDRGILIGQRTFGKGTVQQIFALSDGSSVHITSAEWFTPSRTPLANVGLKPDIEMIPDVNGRDVEMGEALRHLQQQLAP